MTVVTVVAIGKTEVATTVMTPKTIVVGGIVRVIPEAVVAASMVTTVSARSLTQNQFRDNRYNYQSIFHGIYLLHYMNNKLSPV